MSFFGIMGEYSFKRAFLQVKQKDAPKVKEKIMKAIGITTRSSWINRMNGLVEPKVSEAKAIEAVFKEYGIEKVWEKS